MRRLVILLLLCLGLAGSMMPVGAPVAAHAAPHAHGRMDGGSCHAEIGCAHGACLGCAVEPDAPRLSNHHPEPAAASPAKTATVRLTSRPFALDPPPPRRG